MQPDSKNMNNKGNTYREHRSFIFRRWSNARYAIFNSLRCVVHIASMSFSLSNIQTVKKEILGCLQIVFQSLLGLTAGDAFAEEVDLKNMHNTPEMDYTLLFVTVSSRSKIGRGQGLDQNNYYRKIYKRVQWWTLFLFIYFIKNEYLVTNNNYA